VDTTLSNIADLEKMADEAVTILRKARVFIDPTAPLSAVDRSRPDFVIDVPGPTVKDAVTTIVERDPSYATYTSYAYDFDKDCWSIMGSLLCLGPAASAMSDIFWESAKSKLYIYVLLVCSLLSLSSLMVELTFCLEETLCFCLLLLCLHPSFWLLWLSISFRLWCPLSSL
jgi:hypothetical protein